jgi:hypothetical protein
MNTQTIAYGLFSAKATHEGKFAIEDIPAMIPNTNPFLRNLFEECTRTGDTQGDCLGIEELGVLELVKTLKESNIEAVLQDFGKLTRKEDPVIHFYEDFLREYEISFCHTINIITSSLAFILHKRELYMYL